MKKIGLIYTSYNIHHEIENQLSSYNNLSRKNIATKKIVKNKVTNANKAFFADVHEHSFDFSTQLLPVLRSLGFNSFTTKYFNCSPFFFNFPIKPRIWHKWYKLDSHLANHYTRYLCSGGVVFASRLSQKE